MKNVGFELKKYFDDQGVTQADIANRLGVSKAYVNALFNGRNSFGKKQAEKMGNLFGLSSSWLLTGEGRMLADNTNNSTNSTEDAARLDAIYYIPLLPIAAQGGTFNDFVVSVKDSDCEKVISPIKGAEFAMPVSGDSMAPEYPSGAQILIKRINESAFIDWGRVYVLDTCNGVVIKRVFPTDDPNVLECRSINPEYPPFKVATEDIYGIYRVLMCMSLK